MKVHLPNSAFLGNIDPFLRALDYASPESLEITANEKWLSLHPMVLCMLASLGLTVEPSRIQCDKLSQDSRHYLDRMGLFKLLKIPSGIQIPDPESGGRLIPLTQIRDSGELTRCITQLIPLLQLEPKHAELVMVIVSELVANVLEHSLSKDGAVVSAEYTKKSNSVKIAVADTGVGIRETINKSYLTMTDLDAIKLALWPGITGTSEKEGGTERNAGAGLFFVKSIARVNRDFFAIYSGKGLYKLLKVPAESKVRLKADPFTEKHSKGKDFPSWKGTVAGVDISLDTAQEFSVVLDFIGAAYKRMAEEKQKARNKRPSFL